MEVASKQRTKNPSDTEPNTNCKLGSTSTGKMPEKYK
jgi:hypothetical protein